RPYMPGDDPMHVDWKAFARSDKLFIKEFEDETNTQIDILVDISGSMGYSSITHSKLEYALFLASSLAYLSVRQRDAVGLTLFDNEIRRRLPAKSTKRHLHAMLREMERAEIGESTLMRKALHELAEQRKRRGFVILISDMLGDAEGLVEGLKHFRFNGHEVILFQLLDPQELGFDFTDVIEFEDLETGQTKIIDADSAKELYEQNLTKHQDVLKKNCGLLGVDLSTLSTDQPLDFALFNYLAARSGREK
ncbi:MAG: DUF58 domain-containing protein, partial [Rhodothermales bacterium]|nr:DUF58 domain-containing protein [Rhodothermales bacterium]